MRLRKRLLVGIIGLLIALVFSGCSGSGGDQGNGKDQGAGGESNKSPIHIGLAAAQNGFFSWYGKENIKGAQMVVDQVNKNGGVDGRQVKLDIYDTATTAEKAVSAVKKFKADQVDAIAGLGALIETKAALPMVQNGPLTYSTDGAFVPKGKYVFGATVYATDMERKAVKWLKDHGKSSFALISTNDATGQQSSKALKEIAKELDMKVTSIQYLNTSATSATSQLTKIKGTHPDALIAWLVGKPLGVVFKGLQQVNMDVPVVTSHGNLSPTFLKSVADFQPKEFYVPATKDIAWPHIDKNSPQYDKIKDDPQYKIIMDYYNQYKERFGSDPGLGSGTGYDTLSLLIDAFKQVGTDTEDATKYLESLSDYVGVAGTYHFSKDDHRGLDANDAVLLRVVHGEYQGVE